MSTPIPPPPIAHDPGGDDVLHGAAIALSSAEGDAVFRSLVSYLAKSLEVDVAFIALPTGADTCRLRMLAFYVDGRIVEDFEYPLAGTPCETVLGQTYRIYPSGLQQRFPIDLDFKNMGLDCYAGYPLNDAHGKALGLISVGSRRPFGNPVQVESMLKIFAARVVTEIERKRADEALRASEARYRLLFEMESDAIVLIDVESLRIIDANHAAQTLYGYSREELLALTAADLSVEPDLTAEAIRSHTGVGRVPLRLHRKKDGNVFPVDIATNSITLAGRATMLAAIRDVTQRLEQEEALRRSEAQLRQAQKMEAIGHLAGGIAHDFNNILTSVMGYVALAADRSTARADPKLEHYLDQAQGAVHRARDLIRQMLTFSRGQRGEPRPVSLAAALAESTTLLRSTLPSSIELVSELRRQVPRILLDPVHLEQVMLNLCINARDAMQNSGTIRITLDVISGAQFLCASCRQRVCGDFVVLALSDSGPGIEPQVMERMFEPFFTTKDVGKGSGMGLATVHGIVHEYAGHLGVETAAGRGTTFRVFFPPLPEHIQASSAVPALVQPATHGARLSGHVLVVEDEMMVSELLHEMLAGWGLDATVFRNPVEAEAWFMHNPQRVDLVLTDYTMPKITGLELAQRLTLVRPDVPVLLYSGYGIDIDAAQANRSGVIALIAKPVEPSTLFEILREHLPQHGSPPQA